MAEQIVELTFEGGLHTSLHESKIGDRELSDCENIIVEDGIVRLDQRYVSKAEYDGGLGEWTGKGLGWGYYDGTEIYVAALYGKDRPDIPGHPRPSTTRIYTLDATNPVTFTRLSNASGNSTGNWFFQQFIDRIYGVNEDVGLYRFTIGQDDWSRLLQPSKPGNSPTASLYTPYLSQSTFASGSAANSGLDSAVITNGVLVCTSSTPGLKSVTLTYNTKPNWEYRDILSCFTRSTPFITPDLTVIEGASEVDAIIWKRSTQTNKYRIQNIARSNRNSVDKVKFSWEAPEGTFVMRISPPVGWGVWLSLDRDYNPGEENNPVFKPLTYEYTYYDSGKNLESPPSDPAVIASSDQIPEGNWVNLAATVSNQAGVSHIRFYRVIDDVRYRIGEVANAGSPTMIDKFTVDEVMNLPIYRPSSIPNLGITGIAAWQNRLVLSVGSIVYVSAVDDPLYFESIDGAYNEFDPKRGITFYPDDNRSEVFWSCVAQDELYMVSKYSVRALIGNSADNWRLIKIADSEGAVGPRAFAPFKKGVVTLTPNGRLMYHHVGLIEPEELSVKVRSRSGNLGLEELALSDSIVTVTQNGDIDIRGSNGQYMVINPDGIWRKGTHSHPAVATSFISGRPPRWLGFNSKFYEGGSYDYQTDDGTEIFGTFSTKQYLFGRGAVTNVFLGNTPDHEYSGVNYPKITVNSDRPSQTANKKKGLKNVHFTVEASGQAIDFDVVITKNSPLHDFRVTIEKLSEAKHL